MAEPGPPTQSEAKARPSYTQLLRDRSFGSMWTAQVISQSGDAVFDVALLWLVYVTTGSIALVGITQAAVLLPLVLAAPVAGVYADRLNRRNQMIASNLAQGAVTAAISVLYAVNLLSFPVLILLVLLLYTGAVFFRAASNAMLPRIVRKEDLAAANGLFSLSTSANQLVSYSVGGLVIVVLGAEVSVSYDSLTFFVAAVLLTLVAASYGQARGAANGATPGTGRPSFAREFLEGLGYVRRTRLFRELIVFGLVVNFFAGAMVTLLAPYSKDWIHGDAATYGFVLASFALGSIVGALGIGKVNYRAYVGRLLFAGILASAVLFIVAGLVTVIPLALPVFFGIGILIAVVNQPLIVLVQTHVPGEILGRAITVMGSLLAAAQPIAAILSGTLADLSSIGTVFLGSGLAMVASTAVMYFLFADLAAAKY